MLQRVNIKNYRSLKDVTVDLQQVNLLIGPNNSGKTNFLKAFEFLSTFINRHSFSLDYFLMSYFRMSVTKIKNRMNEPISFSFSIKLSDGKYGLYILEISGANKNNEPIYREFAGVSERNLQIMEIDDIRMFLNDLVDFGIVVNNAHRWKIFHDFGIPVPDDKRFVLVLNQDKELEVRGKSWFTNDLIEYVDEGFLFDFGNIFKDIIIYKPDTNRIAEPGKLGVEQFINADASNLVSFLDNIRDIHPEIYERIKFDLNECLDEFSDLRFIKVERDGVLYKKIGLIDKRKKIFWAEELSEGTLYFLALLSIIHQPNPPKLLLLEEPEKGIHPRRIHEVMEYIFRLADEKKIQIVLTTHNTQLVDEFEDTPQSVFVFEMINGATEIKNLNKDIIEPANKKSEETGLPFIRYTELLGEKWFQGFIGGVP